MMYLFVVGLNSFEQILNITHFLGRGAAWPM